MPHSRPCSLSQSPPAVGFLLDMALILLAGNWLQAVPPPLPKNSILNAKMLLACPAAVFHKVSAKFKQTRVHMWQARPGHGVRAHRAIMGICELAGIEDLGGRVTGSTNPLNLVRATFEALQTQTTPEDLGRQKGKSVLAITHSDRVPSVLYRHKVGPPVAPPENS